MFIPYCSKKNKYIKSKRDFSEDYSHVESKKYDMNLSGRYISKYPSIDISIASFDKYPLFKDSDRLTETILKNIKCKCCIILGNGSNGLLQNIIKIQFRKKGNLITPFYTFNQAEFGVSFYNSITKRVYTSNYNIDLDRMYKSIDFKTRMIYLCNPNNPTGIFIDSNKIIDFCNKTKKLVVVDESGIEFTKKKGILETIQKIPDNLIVIRSFSKAFGLANLRMGYIACSEKFEELYLRSTTINEYSGISCLMAYKILKSGMKLVNDNINLIIKERKKIINSLKNVGIECTNSSSNIIFTKTTFNKKLFDFLNKYEVSVIPILDENEKYHIRIAIQDIETNDYFLEIMSNKTIEKYIED